MLIVVYLSNLSFGIILCIMEWSLDPGFHSFDSDTHSDFKRGISVKDKLLPCCCNLPLLHAQFTFVLLNNLRYYLRANANSLWYYVSTLITEQFVKLEKQVMCIK
jgi:hypothetical protein